MAFDQSATTAAYRASINSAPIGRFQILLVLAVLLVLVIDGLDLQLLGLIAPLIVDEWGLERSQFGIALSAALVGMSLGTILGGALGDRFGRLPILLFSTALFGAATVVSGFADSVLFLTGLRLISGLGFGAAAPNGIALVSDWLPDRLRPQITSLLSIGTPAGGMIGAVLVLGILPFTGWRGAFFACGGLTVLLAVGVILFVRESSIFHLAGGKHDLAEAALTKHLGIPAPAVTPLLPQLEPAQLGTKPPVFGFLDHSLLRLNIGGGLGFFLLSFVSYVFIAWTPLMLSSVGFNVDQAIVASFSFNMSAVGAALIGGFLMARFGTRKVLSGSASLLAMSLLILGVLLANYQVEAGAELLIYVLIGAAGGFAGMGMASVYTIMAVGYPSACKASGLGFGLMLGRVGGILASLSGGYFIDYPGVGLWPLVLTLTMCSGVAAICAFVSDKHAAPAIRPTGRAKTH